MRLKTSEMWDGIEVISITQATRVRQTLGVAVYALCLYYISLMLRAPPCVCTDEYVEHLRGLFVMSGYELNLRIISVNLRTAVASWKCDKCMPIVHSRRNRRNNTNILHSNSHEKSYLDTIFTEYSARLRKWSWFISQLPANASTQ